MPVISFDFDDTLTISKPSVDFLYGFETFGSQMVLNLVQEYHALGCRCIILTARYDVPYNVEEITRFLKVHRVDRCIKDIVFTDNSLKGSYARDLNVALHYDDNDSQLESISQYGIRVKKIDHYKEIT